jgi:hypothetical protein
MIEWLVENELVRMQKEAIVTKCGVKSQHFPSWAEKTRGNLSQESRLSSRDLKPGLPEYKTEVVFTRPQRLEVSCEVALHSA